ncbi:MAG: hypothetical protein K8I27_03315 [Planctomycetes bacterium]|nr:hypothetical protein [Planctomycetota bacterium]
MDTKTEQLSDNEAVAMLTRAAEAVMDTLEMARQALAKADRETADKTFLHRLDTEMREARRSNGIDEPKLRSAHPLYPLWSMIARLSKSLERILAMTNPKVAFERKLAELKAKQHLKDERKRASQTAAA